MSFWKYIVKTNWKQKKADWAEYSALRAEFDAADGAVNAARVRISQVYFEFAEPKMRACINHEFKMIDIESGRIPDVGTDVCPNFLTSDNKNGCYTLHCPYAQGNNEYHQKCREADAIRQEVNTFWAKKFARVK